MHDVSFNYILTFLCHTKHNKININFSDAQTQVFIVNGMNSLSDPAADSNRKKNQIRYGLWMKKKNIFF